jgi:hypothetical protein
MPPYTAYKKKYQWGARPKNTSGAYSKYLPQLRAVTKINQLYHSKKKNAFTDIHEEKKIILTFKIKMRVAIYGYGAHSKSWAARH